jgi:hypothetical protein
MENCPLARDCLEAVKALPVLADRMQETHENTVRIVQALHGELGKQDSGLFGRMETMSVNLHNVDMRVGDLETSGRGSRTHWRDRLWGLVPPALLLLAALVSYALIGWHVGLKP